ncbi:hypothetical protein [Streptomyces violens]|uniref:hypothetical protein n=1 Tax=Streptomyces violens TaxID=66377 RepID=UPI000AC7D5E6|nr:hypothetical protein [Streptomyces violens]
MFVHSNALNGNRRHRLVMGAILTPFLVLMGVALSAAAVSMSERPSLLIGLGSAAISAYAVAWWSARYWYTAFREGRSSQPVPEPHPWPWLLPPLVLGGAFATTGIGAVQDGKTAAAVISLVLATMLLLPAAISVVVAMYFLRERRSGTSGTTDAGQNTSGHVPQRPHRAWGSID